MLWLWNTTENDRKQKINLKVGENAYFNVIIYLSSSYLIIDSEGTEKFVMLMNDTFDVLNGRFYAAGISDKTDVTDKYNRTIKQVKWAKLNAMLNVLNITEQEHQSRDKHSSSPSEMFCSATTLKALRLTIISAKSLTEELLENGFHTVLTGKMNQDPIEVKIIPQSSITIFKSSFLQFFFIY